MSDFPSHDTGLAKPVKARGKARKLTDEALDEATAPDTLRAQLVESQSDWKDNAPLTYKTILEAKDRQ